MKIKIITLLLFSCYFTIAQNIDEKKIFASFDKIIGTKNTTLSYGILFKEKYRSLNGNHHYFMANEFKTATIHYNGEPFFNIPLKYDITDDIVIVEYTEDDKKFQIALEANLIKTFTIEDHTFIAIDTHGFLEVLAENTITSLFKKHKKLKYKKLDKSFLYFNFKEAHHYIIKHNNKYYDITKTKDFFTVFPNQKKNIKEFKNKHSFLLKNNPDKFYIQLIKMLDSNRLKNEK